MSFLYTLFDQSKSLFSNLLQQPDWRTFLDVAIIAVLIYQLLRMLMQTRANSVIRGVFIVLVLAWLSDLFGFNTLKWLLQQLIGIGLLLLVVVFQPEIRRGLEQIGRQRLSFSSLRHMNQPYRPEEQIIEELVKVCMRLSRRKVGALIVIERSTGLQDIIETGIPLDSETTAALLENIFEPNTPLHDGAVVMRNGRIVAAACILQLTEQNTISKDLGTRHRAAIGISETADSVSLVVSEETGTISIAVDGKLTRYLDETSLRDMLTGLLIKSRKNSIVSSLLNKKEDAKHE